MYVKDTYTAVFLKSAGKELTPDEIKKHRLLWWWNVRTKAEGGLRLTEAGYTYITEQSQIKTYSIDLPKDFSVTPQILIWLDKFIDSPFYINKRTITVLKEKSAFELYLFSGDVRKLGFNKALARRLSQELTS
jgi:hypothetical protein